MKSQNMFKMLFILMVVLCCNCSNYDVASTLQLKITTELAKGAAVTMAISGRQALIGASFENNKLAYELDKKQIAGIYKIINKKSFLDLKEKYEMREVADGYVTTVFYKVKNTEKYLQTVNVYINEVQELINLLNATVPDKKIQLFNQEKY